MEAGIRSGDTIGLCSDNRIEFPYVLFGTQFLGATLAPMNITYTERELNHAVNLSKPKIVFAAPSIINTMTKVVQQNRFIQQIVLFKGGSKIIDKTVIEFEKFFNNPKIVHNPKMFIYQPQNITDRVSVILCSSGTTGLPKGVQLTHENIEIGVAQHL